VPGISKWTVILGAAVFFTAAPLSAQADAAGQLRASGYAGEQADGYLGIVGTAPAEIRSQVDAVNIKRRAYYSDLAAKRGAKIEEVAATTACEMLRTKVGPGQYYRLPDGVWRQRDGSTPIPLPAYCG
jgi:uncharacterized protein YdbL (DUF1318 family)